MPNDPWGAFPTVQSGAPQGGPIYSPPPQPKTPNPGEGYQMNPDGSASPIPGTPQANNQPEQLSLPDANAKDILGQTGLSVPAFYVLTGQSGSLPRDAATRNAAFKQAEDWAKKSGVDISSLGSQYDSYNQTLRSNIMRNNQTKILEQEISGTIDVLKPLADQAGMGGLNVANVMKLFAGKQVNDPTVQQYRQQLLVLQSELAGMNAAARGNIDQSGNVKTDQSDMADAAQVIANGLNAGGAEGLRQAIENTTEKNRIVLQNNIDATRKAIWGLFGVGDKYKPEFPQPAPAAPGGEKWDRQKSTAFWGGVAVNDSNGNPLGPDGGEGFDPKTGKSLGLFGEVTDTSTPATVQAEASRLDNLTGQLGYTDLAKQGLTLGLTDEASGIGTAIGRALGGDFNIAQNYRLGRDTQQFRLDQAKQRLGYGGTAAEFIGGLALPANALVEGAGAAAKAGAFAGGIGGFGSGRGGEQSAVNALAGTAGGAALGYAGGKAVNALAGRTAAAAPTAAQTDLIAAGERQGVPLRQPDVRPDLRARAGAVAKSEGGKDIMASAANQDVTAIQNAVSQNVAGGAQAVQRETAGRGVQSALAAQKAESSTVRGALYSRVRKLTPGFVATPDKSVAYLDSQIADMQAKNLTDRADVLTKLRDDLANGGLTVDSVQGLRQKVRDIVGKAGIDMDAMDATVSRLQKIAGDELATQMEAKGLNGASAILQKANKLTSEQAQFRQQVVRQLVGPADNPKSGEQVFDTIKSWSQNDFARLQRLYKQLPPDEAKQLSATVAAGLGRDASGKFSYAQFLRAVGAEPGTKPAVSPQAQKLLFGDDGVKALNDLRAIVRAKSDAAAGAMTGGPTQGAVNRLGKGVRSMLFTLVGAGLGGKAGGVEGAIAAGAGINMANRFFDRLGEARAARLLTNPDFTRWLRKLPDTADPKAIDRQFAALDALAAKTPGMLADVGAFKNALVGAVNDNAMLPTAAVANDQQQQNGGQ